MMARIMFPKDADILISGIFKYVCYLTWQRGLCRFDQVTDFEIILDYMSGLNVITDVLKSKEHLRSP